MLSLNKPASQSGTHDHRCLPTASKGNDGNTDGNFQSTCTCTHTNTHNINSDPWWQVDLQEMASVIKIELHRRSDVPDKLKDVDITTSIDGNNWMLCYHFSSIEGIKLTLKCNIVNIARFVRITQKRRTSLILCEVMVFGYFV